MPLAKFIFHILLLTLTTEKPAIWLTLHDSNIGPALIGPSVTPNTPLGRRTLCTKRMSYAPDSAICQRFPLMSFHKFITNMLFFFSHLSAAIAGNYFSYIYPCMAILNDMRSIIQNFLFHRRLVFLCTLPFSAHITIYLAGRIWG